MWCQCAGNRYRAETYRDPGENFLRTVYESKCGYLSSATATFGQGGKIGGRLCWVLWLVGSAHAGRCRYWLCFRCTPRRIAMRTCLLSVVVDGVFE